MQDLFGNEPAGFRRYPKSPGWKSPGPSRDAARAIRGYANTVRMRVLLAYVGRYPGGATADEAAAQLNLSILSARPRVAELHADGLLEHTADRRPNESGIKVTVWRASRKAMEAAHG